MNKRDAIKNLHKDTFTFHYKSWGILTVRHIRNLDGDKVRLEVTEGDDKESSFAVSRQCMLEAIEASKQALESAA